MDNQNLLHGESTPINLSPVVVPDNTLLSVNVLNVVVNPQYNEYIMFLFVRADVLANNKYCGQMIKAHLNVDEVAKAKLLVQSAHNNVSLTVSSPQDFCDKMLRRNIAIQVGQELKGGYSVNKIKKCWASKQNFVHVFPRDKAVLVNVYGPQQLAGEKPINQLTLINVDKRITHLLSELKYSAFGVDCRDLFPSNKPVKFGWLLSNNQVDYSQLLTPSGIADEIARLKYRASKLSTVQVSNWETEHSSYKAYRDAGLIQGGNTND